MDKTYANDIAEFAYDALGRRIRKVDSVAGTTTLYYYNDNWQVLCEYNGSDVLQRAFVYGNYIDEVLCRFGSSFQFYVHDHLHSPVALLQLGAPPTVIERYEYDAYGRPYILEPNFAADPDGKIDVGNPRLARNNFETATASSTHLPTCPRARGDLRIYPMPALSQI